MLADEIKAGESSNIEFKVEVPKKSEKYIKSVVAFANTAGGKIIIGVDDKSHEIVGVDPNEVFKIIDGITNTISDMCFFFNSPVFCMFLLIRIKKNKKIRPGPDTFASCPALAYTRWLRSWCSDSSVIACFAFPGKPPVTYRSRLIYYSVGGVRELHPFSLKSRGILHSIDSIAALLYKKCGGM